MVKTLSLLMAALLLIALAVPALAGDLGNVDVNGQVRWRSLIDDKDFDSDTDATHYTEMRSRLAVGLHPQDNMDLFFQLQDSRIVGADAGTDPMGFSNTINMHQAYLVYHPCSKGAITAGRFEMNMHNQRLVGAVGWSNIGRTFEGVRYDRSFDSFMLNVFATQLTESTVYKNGSSTDRYFAGANAHFNDAGFDLFVYYDDASQMNDMSRFTVGAYSQRDINETFGYESMFAYQFGTYDDINVDIKAWMFYANLTFKTDTGFMFHAIADLTSGSKADDTDMKTFDNLYYTGHKFRGAMDYFVGQPTEGLMDLAGRVGYKFNGHWCTNGTFHYFANMQDRWTSKTLSGGTNGEKAIGTEVDLALTYKDMKNFNWTNGFSFFTLSDKFMPNADTSIWLYSMATMNF